MYYRDHEDPHIHIMSPEGICKMDFEGKVLRGDLPANKLRIIRQWINKHKDQLEHNWTISRDHVESERIEPWKQ
ncbi:MAG: DUF4160 domain-containing protein [Ignavibacteriaceae bacterium]